MGLFLTPRFRPVDSTRKCFVDDEAEAAKSEGDSLALVEKARPDNGSDLTLPDDDDVAVAPLGDDNKSAAYGP